MPFLWDERTLQNGTVFTLGTELGEIDLLAEVSGLGAYDQVKAHSTMVEAFDRRVATLDLPSLTEAKRAAGREKDLSALPELESLLGGKNQSKQFQWGGPPGLPSWFSTASARRRNKKADREVRPTGQADFS